MINVLLTGVKTSIRHEPNEVLQGDPDGSSERAKQQLTCSCIPCEEDVTSLLHQLKHVHLCPGSIITRKAWPEGRPTWCSRDA